MGPSLLLARMLRVLLLVLALSLLPRLRLLLLRLLLLRMLLLVLALSLLPRLRLLLLVLVLVLLLRVVLAAVAEAAAPSAGAAAVGLARLLLMGLAPSAGA